MSEFQQPAHAVCRRERDRLLHGGQASQGKDLVDPFPAVDRFRLADEVRSSGDWRTGSQGVGCQQMGPGGVFHINCVDQVRAVADSPELPAPGPLDQARDKMTISRAPDQMWTQAAGEKLPRPIGGQDILFGECFAMRIMTEPVFRIGGRFVDTLLRFSNESNTGAARVNESTHAVSLAPLNHVVCAECVDTVVVLPGPPDTGHCGDMIDRFDILAGSDYGLTISNVAGDLINSE